MDKPEVHFPFEGIGFNGPHLAKMNLEKLTEEIKHHFPGADGPAKIKELYGLLQEKYNKPAPIAAMAKG